MEMTKKITKTKKKLYIEPSIKMKVTFNELKQIVIKSIQNFTKQKPNESENIKRKKKLKSPEKKLK